MCRKKGKTHWWFFAHGNGAREAIYLIPRGLLVVKLLTSTMHESKECALPPSWDAILKNVKGVPEDLNGQVFVANV